MFFNKKKINKNIYQIECEDKGIAFSMCDVKNVVHNEKELTFYFQNGESTTFTFSSVKGSKESFDHFWNYWNQI